MPTKPTFFFSHARNDMGKFLRRFFQDLEQKVGQWAGKTLPLGTIDLRTEHGDDWDEYLSNGLKTDKVFIGILSPYYGTRANCGKELGVFLQRSPKLGINTRGELTGVTNVLLFRWMPEEAYKHNGEKDGHIPAFLRGIQDGPSDDLGDPAQARAVERYRRRGMQNCVNPGTDYYNRLLEMAARRINELGELPPAPEASFATAVDAFSHDWVAHFNPPPAPGGGGGGDDPFGPQAPSGPSAAHVMAQTPIPLRSLVAFYLTQRRHEIAPVDSFFSDHLISDDGARHRESTDKALSALLFDMRAAALAENLEMLPALSALERLLSHLTALTQANIMLALVIDPQFWQQATVAQKASVRDIVASQSWRGPVLSAVLDGAPDISTEIGGQRVVSLPGSSTERLPLLRQLMTQVRGELWDAARASHPDPERLPLLKGIGGERP